MNPQVKEISKEDPKVRCHYCQQSTVNSLEWGPMYQLAGVSVHYFCMLFSAGLSQNGQDDEGILGFLPIDIRKELKRGEKLKCKFCKLPRATIGCSVKTCKKSYHYPCGLMKGCVFQFIGNFESYCTQHKEETNIPLPKSEWDCPICFCEVTEEDLPLWPPCCKKRVFHKKCIMEMAKNHGAHFFKCPLCNDKDKFSVAMRLSGVYLPDRDATWETVPNAFADHMRLYSKCDAVLCQCPRGREYSSKSESKPYKIVRCGACGAAGIHKRCGNLINLTWRCAICSTILSDKRKNESMNSSRIQRPTQFDLSDDEEMENEAPVVAPVKEAITEAPEVESSSSGTESSSEEDKRKVTTIYDNRYGRHVVMDVSASDDSDDSSDNEPDEIFIQPNTKLRQMLQNATTVSAERRVQKAKMRGLLTNVLKNMNDMKQIGAIFCTQERSDIVNRLKDYVVSAKEMHDDETWRIGRASTFDTKLKTLVQCCRQSSSTDSGISEDHLSSNTDNVSNPVRTNSPGNDSPIAFPPVERDKLIKVDTRKKNVGRVELEPAPEVVSESPGRGIKISLKGAINRPSSTAASTPSTLNTPLIKEDCKPNNVLCDSSEDNANNDSDVVLVDNNKETKLEETCITLDDDDDDSSSDLEIISEKLKPVPCNKSTAFLEMVNKVKGIKSPPAAPVVRLGVDDDQIDDIEFAETINHPVPFSSSSKPAFASTSISAAFLRVINKTKESQYSGGLSSVVRNNMKAGPDRDVETVEIISDDDDDEEKVAQSSDSTKQGGDAEVAKKCSKKRDRLSPNPTPATSSSSAHLNKRPRK